MNAEIYIALIVENGFTGAVDDRIKSFMSEEDKYFRNGDRFLRSRSYVIEFDDLGKSLLEFFESEYVPTFQNCGAGMIAYVQVLPSIDYDKVRIFIMTELMKLLSSKGLGLDIHGV